MCAFSSLSCVVGTIDDKPGIAVAKPYGVRGTTPYTIGEVYAAVLPLCELGQNPGKASASTGHPVSLTETLEFLLTDEGTYINWMLLEGIGESGGTTLVGTSTRKAQVSPRMVRKRLI